VLTQLRHTAPKTVLLAAAALFSVFPLLSMFSAALQPQGSAPAGISFTTSPQWHNFVDAWTIANITPLLVSSIILVAGVVPVAALIATMAGYGLGQLRVPGGTLVFLLLLLEHYPRAPYVSLCLLDQVACLC